MLRIASVLAAVLLLIAPPISAQPVDTAPGREHFFPLIVDGGGFRSSLILFNTADSANECSLQFGGEGFDPARLRASHSLAPSGAGARVALGFPGASLVLTTTGEKDFAHGYVTIDCREPAHAQALLKRTNSDDAGDNPGTTVALAALEGMQTGTAFRLSMPHRYTRIGFALSNPSSKEVNCFFGFGAFPTGGALSTSQSIMLPAGASHIELSGQPPATTGQAALVSCDGAVGAVGLAYQGAVFATLPMTSIAARSHPRASANQIIPLLANGGGFFSGLRLFNPGLATATCAIGINGAGLEMDPILGAASGLTVDVGAGESIGIASEGGDTLAIGHASIACDQPVIAGNTLSRGAGGELLGMAHIGGARKSRSFLFPVLAEIGGMALVVSNDSSASLDCEVKLEDEFGIEYRAISLPVGPAASEVRLLDEVFLRVENVPEVRLSASCGAPASAIALPLDGTAFTALAPVVLRADASIAEPELAFNPADFPPLLVFALGEPIEIVQLPETIDGEPPLTYSVEPEIPGLVFDPATRQLRGTPSEAGEFSSVYRAVDANGKIGLHPLIVIVRGPNSTPSFAGVEAPTDQSYTLGVEIEPLPFPQASGGNAPLFHFLTPEVPGLVFNSANRQLSGTPTRTGVYPMTYNAADADFDLDSRNFTITVTVPESAREAINANGCSDGGFIDDPAASPGLVADCRALVGFANSLIESGLIMDDNAIRQWGSEGRRKLANWSGIGVADEDGGRISRIALPFSGIKGALPAALGDLDALTIIDLRGNELSGPIPAGFGNLARLETLDISSNRLSGGIPAELGRLGLLQTLWLGGNGLSGGIPRELGQLDSLRELSLASNKLSGTIPTELAELAKLRRLDLGGNGFDGAIPAELGQLRDLRTLSLSGNKLSGPIPPEIGQLGQLEELSLSRNMLGGAIPAELAMARSLRNLDLSGNELGGAIPPALAGLAGIAELNFAMNRLEGVIPAGFAALASLETLDVSFNRLRGSVDWAFRERIFDGSLRIETGGNLVTGLAPPPGRQPAPPRPDATGNASHHSIAWYQGPLVFEWDWRGGRVEHQTPILGRWALIAVRIEHSTQAPPPVSTELRGAGGAVLAESLAEAAPPITEAVEEGRWRSEFLFYLPGEWFEAGNQLVPIIDPENTVKETDETDNAVEPLALHGERPPKFRAVFIPMLMPGEEAWHQDLDPKTLMAGTLAFMPIADDFEARFGPSLEITGDDVDAPLLDLLALWNAEAEPDEFYHGIINGDSGGVALFGSRVAVSELSIHRVIPHEFGHNLGLQHTPGCVADDVDEEYPYADGALGPDPAWERNWRLFASGGDEDYTDIMSYCTELKLISDYNYRLAAEYWLAQGRQTSTSAVVSGPEPAPSGQTASFAETGGSIAFSGRIGADGVWRLGQAQWSSRQPRPPAEHGGHTLILLDAAGSQVHLEPLSVLSMTDGEGSFWAARTPAPRRQASELVIIDPRGNEVLRQRLPVFQRE